MNDIFDNIWYDLGARIAKTRKNLGFSQMQLAESAEISKEHLSNLERGKKLPSAKVLTQIAGALNVSVDYLLGLNNTQTDIEINIQLQEILINYTIIEKEAILNILRDVKAFSELIRKNN